MQCVLVRYRVFKQSIGAIFSNYAVIVPRAMEIKLTHFFRIFFSLSVLTFHPTKQHNASHASKMLPGKYFSGKMHITYDPSDEQL